MPKSRVVSIREYGAENRELLCYCVVLYFVILALAFSVILVTYAHAHTHIHTLIMTMVKPLWQRLKNFEFNLNLTL